MKRQKAGLIAIGLLLVTAVCLAQWGGGGLWTVPSGGLYLNCPANACSVTGQMLNFPGLSAKSQLLAASAGSATNTLINTGLSFPIAANQVGTLNCEIYYTSTSSSGGLALGVNGPGTPTQVTIGAQIQTSATAQSIVSSQGTSWQTQIGTVADTLTSGLQFAELAGGIENGPTAGTLNIQFADINTNGTVTVARDSWCSFP
jgi:hypothetical protein